MVKEIHVVVYSGMCNRMFTIASGLRISKKYGHALTVFWPERTGRYGLPYYGNTNSDWDDYFERIRSVPTYGIHGSIVFQDKGVVINQESAMPEWLPRNANGQRVLPADRKHHLLGPKIVDPAEECIIVQKSTKPFGTPEDGMEHYKEYIKTVGKHKKTPYLQELSDCCKQMKLLPFIQTAVDELVTQFSKFDRVFGIHIRGTDLAPQTKSDRRATVAAIIAMSLKESLNTGFYVASDEPIDWIIELAPNNTIYYNNDVKFENSVQGVQNAMVDLYTLSKCGRIYGSAGSSFSMMSWMLSDSDYYIHS